ncbi:MAG TPA: tetratricopeptide repeat protein [Planctomycetaceae bacterium]|nr:tetratricopeptide repeat protein [Planctomycetaceae bacterium]
MADRKRSSAGNSTGKGKCRAQSRLERMRSRSQREFELEFYERVLRRQPNYVEALKVHASNLAAVGRFQESLEIDRRLVQLRPDDPVVHYNLGCSYAQLGQLNKALAAIERSLQLGYNDLGHMLADGDLAELRRHARFVHLVRKYWSRH